MAREVIEKLIDDLDGGDAVETVSFALGRHELRDRPVEEERGGVPEVAGSLRQRRSTTGRVAATPASRASHEGGRQRRKAKRDFDLAKLRAWAGANGVAVPSRGRIPQAVVEQYKAAGGR